MSPPGVPPTERAVPAPFARAEVPPWRLVVTLGLAGALAGLLLVFVHRQTEGAIRAHKQRALEAAIGEVLGLGATPRFEKRYVAGQEVHAESPPGGGEEVYLGLDEAGGMVGFAVVGAANGYADEIRLIFGYDPRRRTVLGMKVLESKETPGLGDSVEKNAAWVALFPGKVPPIEAVKPGESRGDPHRIDTITGATISSKTVIGIVRDALARLGPALDAWAPPQGQAGGYR